MPVLFFSGSVPAFWWTLLYTSKNSFCPSVCGANPQRNKFMLFIISDTDCMCKWRLTSTKNGKSYGRWSGKVSRAKDQGGWEWSKIRKLRRLGIKSFRSCRHYTTCFTLRLPIFSAKLSNLEELTKSYIQHLISHCQFGFCNRFGHYHKKHTHKKQLCLYFLSSFLSG